MSKLNQLLEIAKIAVNNIDSILPLGDNYNFRSDPVNSVTMKTTESELNSYDIIWGDYIPPHVDGHIALEYTLLIPIYLKDRYSVVTVSNDIELKLLQPVIFNHQRMHAGCHPNDIKMIKNHIADIRSISGIYQSRCEEISKYNNDNYKSNCKLVALVKSISARDTLSNKDIYLP